MPQPQNPKTVVLSNKYYPTGLTEEMVWKYYLDNKNKILEEISNRPVMLYIFIEEGEWIVKRKITEQLIKINSRNYEQIITGRTVSIHVEMGSEVDYLVIDIDAGEESNEVLLKQCISDILDSSFSKSPLIKKHRVILSANGYHLHFLLNKRINIDTARNYTEKLLNMDLSKKYLINSHRKMKYGEINLDLSPMKRRGLHVVPYALNKNGLIALDITNDYISFDRRRATIG